jgi:hypothetical protein
MYRHIWKNRYVPNYTRWILHGKRQRLREAVVRPDLEGFDADAGMADLLADIEAVQGVEVEEEDPEDTTKAYYAMMEAAQRPLHANTHISKLDAISRLIGLKSSLGISREGFDLVLATIGGLLPELHCLLKSTYESQRLLRALKIPYDPIQACKNGCVLVINTNSFNLCHCRHSTKCQAEGGHDETSPRSTWRRSTRTRRRRSTWRPTPTRTRTRSLRWSTARRRGGSTGSTVRPRSRVGRSRSKVGARLRVGLRGSKVVGALGPLGTAPRARYYTYRFWTLYG